MTPDSTRMPENEAPLGRDLRGSLIFGLVVIVGLIGGGVFWAAQAPLSGAVIANGVIGFEGERKTVQHLEGGIIKQILVKEGDRVDIGTALVVLDDTIAEARVEELRNRIRTLAAEEARLRSERAGKPAIDFDHPMLQAVDDPEITEIRQQQQSHFEARANNMRTKREILNKRVSQIEKQTVGLQRQLEGTRAQLRLVQEEAAVVRKMVAQGHERKPRLLAIMRAEAQLVAAEGNLFASVARNEEAIGETRIRTSNLQTAMLEQIDAKMTDVKSERLSAEKLYRETTDRLGRTRVTSPVAGVVLDIRFKNLGGVVRPGEPILDIAPARDELIVNARIRPTDIDEVSEGSPATVMFVAFQQRHLKRVNGKVVHVSADAFEDKSTGARYFAVDVRIDRRHLAEVAPDLVLAAGMPADVFITTADRTLASYLIQPIMRTFDRAFRES